MIFYPIIFGCVHVNTIMVVTMLNFNCFLLDINECEEDKSQCEHICKNTDGSYECGCRNGYYLEKDNRTCNGQYLIIVICSYLNVSLCMVVLT